MSGKNPIRLPTKSGSRTTFSPEGGNAYVHVWFDEGVAQTDYGQRVPDSGEWQVIISTSSDPLNQEPRGRDLGRQTFRFADPKNRDLVYGQARDYVRSALFRHRNPARPEFIDTLTGTRVSGLVHGASRTGQKVVRTRPAPGEPFQTLPADSDTLDPRRDTYGVDAEFTQFYRDEAARQAKKDAKARKAPPFPRDAELELGRLGIKTTFKTPDDALVEFESLNDSFFENDLLDDLDASDVTHDFMDRLEVGRGRRGAKRKHVVLSQTKRGQDILDARGGRQVREMLKYLFGSAGRRRRWKDVPWYMVDEYISQVGEVIEGEASRQHISTGALAAAVRPLGSGDVEPGEFFARASDEIGLAKAQKAADVKNSQFLWSLVSTLEEILKPPKGPAGKEARATLKCIPTAHRKLLRHRIRVLTEWAKWPTLVPEWACVPDERYQGAEVCSYPALSEDVLRVREACDEPYDVTWPEGAGDVVAEALAPEELPAAEPEDLDLPWERPAANPRQSNIAALRRRLLR